MAKNTNKRTSNQPISFFYFLQTDLFFFNACSSVLHVADLSVFVLDLEWFCFRFLSVFSLLVEGAGRRSTRPTTCVSTCT